MILVSFQGLKTPSNHLTVTCEEYLDVGLKSVDFNCVKIKAGKNLEKDLSLFRQVLSKLGSQAKIRIDFNSSPCNSFIESLKASEIERIDFVEDPGDSSSVSYSQIKAKYKVRIASDRREEPLSKVTESYLDSIDVVVVKPAYEGLNQLVHSADKEICFTNNMDHPLGTLQSLYVASRAVDEGYKVIDCGFLTHLLFEETPYSAQLEIENSRLLPVRGEGFGFSDLLEKEKWLRLSDV